MGDVTDVADTPEFPSPGIVDSWRLMGPNLYSAREGAVLELDWRLFTASATDVEIETFAEAWRAVVLRAYSALAWPDAECTMHHIAHGAYLFVTAPLDGLMTATELNEQAWANAESLSTPDWTMVLPQEMLARLRHAAEAERVTRPQLRSLRDIAVQRGVNLLFDDDAVTLGSGEGSRTWPLAEVPTPDLVPWDGVHDVPIALVAGSNGKTTTTRLVGAMWRAAGVSAGWSCSDGVWVEDEQIEGGDFSGPAGARLVLRDVRVRAAVLETARGGMLRRGLAVQRASAAIITNIAADHFGEYGVESLHDLARVKAIVARALDADGCLVLNADDETLVAIAPSLGVTLAWFSMQEPTAALGEHLANGGDGATIRDGHIWLHRRRTWHDLGAVAEMPLTLGGAAPHNIANLLGASLLAATVGVPLPAIRATLRSFGTHPSDNPGRLQIQRFGGMTVLVDYAHNPEGLAALCRTALTIPATRRVLLLGQAGDRDDAQLRALVRAAWDVIAFDRVIIKEMVPMLRGRALGALPRIFADELARVGAPPDRVEIAASEFDAIHDAFAWAADGDVLICPVHVEKSRILAWLAVLRAQNWRPGAPLPE